MIPNVTVHLTASVEHIKKEDRNVVGAKVRGSKVKAAVPVKVSRNNVERLIPYR